MGIIEKVSGPIVIANKMLGAKMYDVVKVGDSSLIGEIIQLNEDKAIIQVYEDTAGIRPGEKVETTEHPLSVNLGPGLIANIYDGIQRPLEKIEKELGAYISKGISINSLDLKKKWNFVANKDLKRNTEIKEGDILGYVQETDIIKHYIMVPPGIKGKLDELKSGKMTITQTVATIKDGSKKIEIPMMQMRAVRKAGKYKNKLMVDEPLVTGQRVVDTFFPIAKGGTAAVPGAFGTGKCVTGDTPVMMADGNIITMEELYNANSRNSKVIVQTDFETLLETERPIELNSFVNQKIVKSISKYIYKGKSDSVIEIKTRTGRKAKITPVHKLFKIGENGEIIETMAKDLKIGDYIASARKIQLTNKDKAIKFGRNYDLGSRKKIIIPSRITPELAEFIGHFVAQGYIRSNKTVVYTNSDETLLNRVIELGKILFGLDGKLEMQENKTPNVLMHSVVLVDFIKFLGVGDNARTKQIPKLLMQSSDSSIYNFMRAYYLWNGTFSSDKIELSTASNKLNIQLSYILTRMGIMHSMKTQIMDKFDNKIVIKGKENLVQFYALLTNTLDKTSYEKLEKIKLYETETKTEYTAIDIAPLSSKYMSKMYACVKTKNLKPDTSGINMYNYTGKNEKESVEIHKKFIEKTEDAMKESEFSPTSTGPGLMLEHIYGDEIVSLKKIDGNIDVYDVTVPEFGSNFVGGFGAIVLHNTVIQHQLAKWSDAQIIIYIGCGERGNEMTEVLTEFPELKDPKTGKPLMERTILIANTSNMPVAAREASIDTGITIAEYFRDMGYDVAVMADSTSRWAEAMREVSARLEEMPGEEGYPAYLPKRLAEFYERGGKVETLNGKQGSITIIGAVSPPGGDISEPVSQGTLRITKTFWALDAALASSRHFPSINWLSSYSLYDGNLKNWYLKNIGKEFIENKDYAMKILQREAELKNIVQLVGADALPDSERIILEVGRMIRENFLFQSAYDDIDTFSSLNKQYKMLDLILHFNTLAESAVKEVSAEKIMQLEAKKEISRMREISEKEFAAFAENAKKKIENAFSDLLKANQ